MGELTCGSTSGQEHPWRWRCHLNRVQSTVALHRKGLVVSDEARGGERLGGWRRACETGCEEFAVRSGSARSGEQYGPPSGSCRVGCSASSPISRSRSSSVHSVSSPESCSRVCSFLPRDVAAFIRCRCRASRRGEPWAALSFRLCSLEAHRPLVGGTRWRSTPRSASLAPSVPPVRSLSPGEP